MRHAILIKADDSAAEDVVIEPGDARLAQLQRLAAGGGTIATVRIAAPGLARMKVLEGAMLVIDDEGLLKAARLNVRATMLADQAIVGDALICGTEMVDTGEGYSEPDIAGLTEDQHARITTALTIIEAVRGGAL